MEFSLPDDLGSIDSVYDPYMRSVLLKHVLKRYVSGQELNVARQPRDGTTFHVIHPILKHVAMMVEQRHP